MAPTHTYYRLRQNDDHPLFRLPRTCDRHSPRRVYARCMYDALIAHSIKIVRGPRDAAVLRPTDGVDVDVDAATRRRSKRRA